MLASANDKRKSMQKSTQTQATHKITHTHSRDFPLAISRKNSVDVRSAWALTGDWKPRIGALKSSSSPC